MSYRIRCATAQSPGELRVALNGGDFEKACIEAYVKPFEAETGVKVTPVGEEIPQSTLELMVSTNSVSLDVIPVTAPMAAIAAEKRLLEEIDYSIYKKDELDAMMDFTKTPYSVGSIVYALCMAYNTEKFPVSKPRPATWEEFWNVAKYPGVRALPSGEYGDSGPWEEALLA
ncbi:extracellular solute-binding protein, partial [Sinorhizobium meliloti]|nr:extracellular solute-binding protein [Sinorhizobium meliloti]MDX0328547.1 extracellular solute-binding protein [Sinorhizobium meliloti]